MKKNFLIAGILSSALLFTGCDTKDSIDESMVAKPKDKKEIGTNFDSKEFKLQTVDGKSIDLKTTLTGIDFKDYKGKVVLIDVFATWCPPCIKGIPDMNKLKEKYAGEFEIISVLFEKDKSKEEIQEFIKKHDIQYPVTIGEENFRFTKDLGEVSKVPEYYLYDKDGTYIKKFVGETDKSLFERYIDKALNN